MLIPRLAKAITLKKAASYPIVAITGPRQAGKSTLAKMLFPKKSYVNLEALDTRRFAHEDPRGFLAQFPDGAVLDEIQHAPELFSYLQVLVDEKKINSLFILTGSQQFGLMEKITQSLAGRVGLIQLLPFSFIELKHAKWLPEKIEDLLWKGCYPPVYDRKITSNFWYADYITTYLERDIRQLINVQDLRLLHKFLQLCAGRTGQLLNLSSLANDCGISHNTAKAWISVLETSYIIMLLSPYHNNFNKRLIKSPKLYFYDTGLICNLLGISHTTQLVTHPLRGQIFETWVVSELFKNRFNHGLLSNIHFWRDSQGHEIDVIIESLPHLTAIEIKAGQTINQNYFTEMLYWRGLTGYTNNWIVYAGDESQKRSQAKIIGWKNLNRLTDALK